jgi:hypothetical protein
MKRWRKNILYKKIRLVGLTLGPVAAGVAGGPCNRFVSIKFRFCKGTKKLYRSNLLHLATFHRIQGKEPCMIYIKNPSNKKPKRQPGYKNQIDKQDPNAKFR